MAEAPYITSLCIVLGLALPNHSAHMVSGPYSIRYLEEVFLIPKECDID